MTHHDQDTGHDNGTQEANSQGAGVNLQSHAQEKAPKPDDAHRRGGDRRSVEDDARGQFTQSQEGRENNGVTSASPRVTTGTDDATFKHESGD
jgi:hypothetical protein